MNPSSTPLTLREVDVFCTGPFTGNGLAVVHDADHLTDEQMRAVARWTQFSETAFLLSPTDPAADYRVRIFTPTTEYPFAGHPTLGAAHAWLEAGGVPRLTGQVVQECGIGLVPVRREETGGSAAAPDAGGADTVLAFAAPPRRRTGPLDPDDLQRVLDALGLEPSAVVDHAWGTNGPEWRLVELQDADAVRAVDATLVGTGLRVGLVGFESPGAGVDYTVRVLTSQHEDAVTGSLHAAAAQWMRERGRVPARWVATQGASVGRAGQVQLHDDGEHLWVGGRCHTRVRGTLDLASS